MNAQHISLTNLTPVARPLAPQVVDLRQIHRQPHTPAPDLSLLPEPTGSPCAEPEPESERRPALRAAPEAIFWHGLVTGAFRLIGVSFEDSSWVAVAREQAPGASRLSSLELTLLHRVLQGEPQKNLAFDFELSAATISQLLGSARAKLGLGDRMTSTPLPVVLLALRHSNVIALPSVRFTRFQREGCEHVELGLPVLEPEALNELSHGERQVALLFARGATYLQIADSRGTSPRTVSNQIASLCTKLRIHGRFELIRRWAERQWG